MVVATGLGSFLGNLLAGEIVSWNGGIGAPVFVVPALVNVVALILVFLGFRPVGAPTAVPNEGPAAESRAERVSIHAIRSAEADAVETAARHPRGIPRGGGPRTGR